MIIYPSNINQDISKSEGRKVSKKSALSSPKAEEMLKALQKLGHSEAILEKNASYPRKPWESTGRVVLEAKTGKRQLMKMLAKEIRRMRNPS